MQFCDGSEIIQLCLSQHKVCRPIYVLHFEKYIEDIGRAVDYVVMDSKIDAVVNRSNASASHAVSSGESTIMSSLLPLTQTHYLIIVSLLVPAILPTLAKKVAPLIITASVAYNLNTVVRQSVSRGIRHWRISKLKLKIPEGSFVLF